MRTLLRHRRVYVPTGHRIRIANALHNLLTEFIPWPADEPTNPPPQTNPVSDNPESPSENQNPEGEDTITEDSGSPSKPNENNNNNGSNGSSGRSSSN